MALAQHGIGWLGVEEGKAIMAPSGGPLKMAGLQGKRRRVGGPCPLGAAMDTSGLASRRAKYCHNEGMALAPHQAVATEIADERRATPEGP